MTISLINPQNLDEKKIQEEFIKNLMNNPGCYLNVPMPLVRRLNPSKERTEFQVKLCAETSRMLTMMGIKHKVISMQTSIMIEDPQ